MLTSPDHFLCVNGRLPNNMKYGLYPNSGRSFSNTTLNSSVIFRESSMHTTFSCIEEKHMQIEKKLHTNLAASLALWFVEFHEFNAERERGSRCTLYLLRAEIKTKIQR